MAAMDVIGEAQAYLQRERLDGWLVYDHRGSNPVFADLTGDIGFLTRPVFYLIPPLGQPHLLAHAVDAGKLTALAGERTVFASRDSLLAALRGVLTGRRRVAMEYVPQAALPLSSRVDAGTMELVRSMGVEPVSSADLVQYATCRWSPEQLESHRLAARQLTAIVREGFAHVGERLRAGHEVHEHGLREVLRRRMEEEGLEAPDGPIVAANAHASDPHYEPGLAASSPIRRGDWVLVDIWARPRGEGTVYADITWTAYVGATPPARNREVFDTVIRARDAAVEALRRAPAEGRALRGFEADGVAREAVRRAGFEQYFTHRLGHSIGREVHGNGANLDGWETKDTRLLIPGTGFSVEPGIYLPEFGVRSEINVYLGADGAPEVTTEPQREIVTIRV